MRLDLAANGLGGYAFEEAGGDRSTIKEATRND
jgi:hypothetical protein